MITMVFSELNNDYDAQDQSRWLCVFTHTKRSPRPFQLFTETNYLNVAGLRLTWTKLVYKMCTLSILCTKFAKREDVHIEQLSSLGTSKTLMCSRKSLQSLAGTISGGHSSCGEWYKAYLAFPLSVKRSKHQKVQKLNSNGTSLEAIESPFIDHTSRRSNNCYAIWNARLCILFNVYSWQTLYIVGQFRSGL